MNTACQPWIKYDVLLFHKHDILGVQLLMSGNNFSNKS